MNEARPDNIQPPAQRRASGSLSGSESDSERDHDPSLKRKRSMNVTYVYPRFCPLLFRPISTMSRDSMADVISCEACKARKVKCGRCLLFLPCCLPTVSKTETTRRRRRAALGQAQARATFQSCTVLETEIPAFRI